VFIRVHPPSLKLWRDKSAVKSLGLCWWFVFDRCAHPRQPLLKQFLIVRGCEGAFGQFGDAFHLFTEHLPPVHGSSCFPA